MRECEVKVPQSVLSAHAGQDEHGREWYWPCGAGPVAACRALARHGYAQEETGLCDGCKSHEAGTEVPVFVLADGVRLVLRR